MKSLWNLVIWFIVLSVFFDLDEWLLGQKYFESYWWLLTLLFLED